MEGLTEGGGDGTGTEVWKCGDATRSRERRSGLLRKRRCSSIWRRRGREAGSTRGACAEGNSGVGEGRLEGEAPGVEVLGSVVALFGVPVAGCDTSFPSLVQ